MRSIRSAISPAIAGSRFPEHINANADAPIISGVVLIGTGAPFSDHQSVRSQDKFVTGELFEIGKKRIDFSFHFLRRDSISLLDQKRLITSLSQERDD
jgi:hypothetical protein